MAKRGRPSKLTKELTKQICDLLKDGNFVETVCDFVGISKEELDAWTVCDGNLQMVPLLEALAYADALSVIRRAAESGDKDAGAWLRGEGYIRITRTHKSHFVRFSTQSDRYSPEAHQWTKDVYERDNYTCRDCGKTGEELNAHHIQSWADYPERRYDIGNGKTVCCTCHTRYHSDVGWMRKGSNTSRYEKGPSD